jgi:hypothetical protein
MEISLELYQLNVSPRNGYLSTIIEYSSEDTNMRPGLNQL